MQNHFFFLIVAGALCLTGCSRPPETGPQTSEGQPSAVTSTITPTGPLQSSDQGLFLEDPVLSAEYWLSLVDNRLYADSWNEGAAYLKANITQKDWISHVQRIRRRAGSLLSRKLINQTNVTSLPGSPQGEYIIMQYQTAFTNNKTAVEIVTPMKEGKLWKVTGYTIQ